MKQNRQTDFSKPLADRPGVPGFRAAIVLGILLASGFQHAAGTETPKPGLSRYSPGAKAAFERVSWNKMDGASHIVGFNYQPSWGSTGPQIWLDRFDAAKYKSELARGKELFPQMNTVRLWLSWGAWKKNPEAYIANLKQAFAACKELDLLMIPVLFTIWDGNPPYDPVGTDWSTLPFEEFEKYVSATLAACPGNVLAWDLCNEPVSVESNEWLKKLADFVHKKFPGNPTTIGMPGYGTTPDGMALFDSCDLWTTHPYKGFRSKPTDKAYLNKENLEERKAGYLAITGKSLKAWKAAGLQKPVVASECCWGSLDDEVRALVVEGSLDGLAKLGVGFLPHALYTSPVADLHLADLGPAANPGYMAFIRTDGSLRPGHDIFNKYAAIATGKKP